MDDRQWMSLSPYQWRQYGETLLEIATETRWRNCCHGRHCCRLRRIWDSGAMARLTTLVIDQLSTMVTLW